MANQIPEPRSFQSRRFHMLAPLTARPRQQTCAHDENQLLKSHIKLFYRKFWRVCPKPRNLASPKMQVYNFI